MYSSNWSWGRRNWIGTGFIVWECFGVVIVYCSGVCCLFVLWLAGEERYHQRPNPPPPPQTHSKTALCYKTSPKPVSPAPRPIRRVHNLIPGNTYTAARQKFQNLFIKKVVMLLRASIFKTKPAPIESQNLFWGGWPLCYGAPQSQNLKDLNSDYESADPKKWSPSSTK